MCCGAPEISVQRRLLLSFEAESCSDWCEYMKVASPVFLLQCMTKYGYYEIVAVLAGYVGKTALVAASASVTYISGWPAQCQPYGIGVSASVLVGNATGAGSAKLAKKIAVLSIGFGLVTWGLVALIAAVSSDDYGRNLAGFGACYYLIMLPSAILLTFAFNVGVEGL